MVYYGPVRPETDVEVFRATGRSVPRRTGGGGGGGVFVGPVRPTTDEEIFRKTGKSVITGSPEAIQIRREIVQEESRIEQEKIRVEQERVKAETESRQATIEFQSRELQRVKPTLIERAKEVGKLIIKQPSPFGVAPEVKKVFGVVAELGREQGREDIRLRNKLIAKIQAGEKLTKKELNFAMNFGLIPDTRGANIPYGLQPIIKGDPRFQITKSIFIKPVEKLTGEKIPETIALKIPFTDKTITIKPKQQLDLFVKASIFSVLMQTATAQKGAEAKASGKTQQQQLKDFVGKTKKQLGKKEIQKIVSQGKSLVSRVEQEFIKGGTKGAEDFITKNLLSKATTDAQRQGLFSLLKSLQHKGVIRSFIYDTQTGQIQFGDIATLQTGTTPLLSSEILSQVPPQLEQIAPVISGTGVVTGSRITNEEAIKRRKDFLKKQEELMNQASDPFGITRISDKKKDKQILSKRKTINKTQFDKQVQDYAQEQEKKLKDLTKLIQPQRQPQILKQVQPQITEQMLRQVPKQVQPTIPRQPQFPRQPQIPIIPLITLQKLKKPITPPTPQGYNVYGKKVKTNEFMKLNKVPLTKINAQNLGAYLTDESLARTFKLKPISSPPQKPKLKVPKNQFLKTRHKFRDYRIIKGQRKPLKNKWIENKFHLLDTRAEVNDISLRKAQADLQKRSVKRRKALKPQRRKKLITLKEIQKRQPQKQIIKSEDLFAPIEIPSVF